MILRQFLFFNTGLIIPHLRSFIIPPVLLQGSEKRDLCASGGGSWRGWMRFTTSGERAPMKILGKLWREGVRNSEMRICARAGKKVREASNKSRKLEQETDFCDALEVAAGVHKFHKPGFASDQSPGREKSGPETVPGLKKLRQGNKFRLTQEKTYYGTEDPDAGDDR